MHDFAPVLAVLAIMMVPLVAILVKHQQRMAMILRQPMQGAPDASVMRLAEEVRSLREIVNQQTLALDSLAESNKRITAALEGSTSVQNRLSV